MNKFNVDMLKLQMKITYLWLAYAILAPGAYVIIAYLMNQGEPLRPPAENHELFFWGFLALSLLEGLAALYLRGFLMRKPTILSEETFQQDFGAAVWNNFIIVSVLVEAIAIYGLLQFFAFGAEVKVVMLFAIIAVIFFQIVRPREGFLSEALRIQEEHVAHGRFAHRRR